MADFLFTNSMLMLERAMNFQWTKQTVINDNIVNAETPNYKVKYVTFEEALDDQIRSVLHNTDRRASAMRSVISGARPPGPVGPDERTPLEDNSANNTKQETGGPPKALQMQYTMDAINSNLSLMRTLIRGQ